MGWKNAIEYRDGKLHVDKGAALLGIIGGLAVFRLLSLVLAGKWLYAIGAVLVVIGLAVDVRLRRRDASTPPSDS